MRNLGRRLGWWLLVLVALCGLVLALADVGMPLPVAAILAALFVVIAACLVMGVIGYRASRAEGRGIWRSIGSGVRAWLEIVFFFAW